MRRKVDVSELTNGELIDKIFQPFILALYRQANLCIPENFDPRDEAERLIVAIQTQGFNARFPVVRRQV